MLHARLIFSSCCLKKVLLGASYRLGLVEKYQTNIYENSQVQMLVEQVMINLFHKFHGFQSFSLIFGMMGLEEQ